MTAKSNTSTNNTDQTSGVETFEISLEAAEFYESRFVPALFAEWAPVILDAAAVAVGDRLLDVACGTGIVARTARTRLGPDAEIVGVDLNEAMLDVAGRVEPSIDWRPGDVSRLPFGDGSFDVAVCQMAFMFFPDRRKALAEMSRVVGPQGRVAVVVPASLEVQPAYRPFVEVAAAHVGPEARSLLGTYWNCGDLGAFVADTEAVGLGNVVTRTRAGSACFDSVEGFVDTEIDASPLADRISGEQRRAIVEELAPQFEEYEAGDGTLTVPLLCHVLSARSG